MSKEAENYYYQFMDQFQEAVDRAVIEDKASRLTLGFDEADVTIDIYRSKGSIKALNSMVVDAAKQHRGLNVLAKPEGGDEP